MTDTDYDDDPGEDYDEAPPSPEQLSSTTSNAVVSNDPPTLTVNVEMARSTEYAKEKKAVSAFLKTALPDRAILEGADGSFQINPAWTTAVDEVAKGMLGVLEVAVARQHGLEVSSDDQGVVRVLNLFAGAKAGPAPAPVAPGPFVAPAAVAPAPAAPVAPAPVAPAPVAPAVPGAVPQGTFQPPAQAAPAAPQQQGGGQKSNNPNAWSNIGLAAQQELAANIEAWCAAGRPQTQGVFDNFGGRGRYPGIKWGQTNVGGNVILKNQLFGPNAKAYAQSQLPPGQSDFG